MLLKNKRIFVLEDDPTNLAIISVILREHGAVVHFERWGVDTAKQLLSFLPVDIILLDLMLPNKISGYDVYDQIRAFPELKQIPVVAVTASDSDIERKKAREKGFQGFINKPIRYTYFPKLIAAVLNGEQVWSG
jgi:CheY-like chemotaxis protein